MIEEIVTLEGLVRQRDHLLERVMALEHHMAFIIGVLKGHRIVAKSHHADDCGTHTDSSCNCEWDHQLKVIDETIAAAEKVLEE